MGRKLLKSLEYFHLLLMLVDDQLTTARISQSLTILSLLRQKFTNFIHHCTCHENLGLSDFVPNCFVLYSIQPLIISQTYNKLYMVLNSIHV